MLFAFLFLLLTSSSLAVITPFPEIQFAFSFDALDAFKNTALKQIIEQYADNITINNTFRVDQDLYHFEIHNIAISQFDLDWEDSHLVTLDGDNKPSIVLQNISAFASFDSSIKTIWGNTSASGNTLLIEGLNITINLDFGTFPNNTAYTYISDTTVKLGTLNVNLNYKIIQWFISIGKKLYFPIVPITSYIIQQGIIGLNDTIVEKSCNGVQVQISNFLQIQGSLASVPQVFIEEGGLPFQSIALNLNLTNIVTGQTAPVAPPSNSMPNYTKGGLPIQVFLSENVIGQALWAVFQSDLLNIEISNATFNSSPISLSTSALTILFPNIAKDFGDNKGVYLKIGKGGDKPFVAISDGRLVAEIALFLDFYVDKDSSQYPNQGLDNCTACKLAYSLKVEPFVALDLYQYNATYIGANVIDIEIEKMELIYGDLDLRAFEVAIDNLLPAILLQVNTLLGKGIKNPLIGKYGVKESVFSIGEDYVFAGFEFNSDSNLISMIYPEIYL